MDTYHSAVGNKPTRMNGPLSIGSLSVDATDFAVASGLIKQTKSQAITHIPFTLFPSPVPKDAFEKLLTLQPHINKLMFLSSQDFEFVSSSLNKVIETDKFTGNLFKIYAELQTCSTKSEFDFGLFRSDYMFDCVSNSDGKLQSSPKQIEVNTVAAAFAGIGCATRLVHCKVLKATGEESKRQFLPENSSCQETARGLVSAWKAYANQSAVVVFFTSADETNIYDQRALEYEICRINEEIPVRRKTFDDMINGRRVSDNGKFFVDNEEVAVIYFRCGYAPTHFPTKKHWEARRAMELSRAIKCPSVGLQLVGCKKIQEVFAQTGKVEKFIKDKHVAAEIRSTFAGLYTLDMNSEGDAAMKMAMSDPDKYVLKPQREGGGNNLYGNDIVSMLKEIGSDNRRNAYILMDRIRPRTSKNYLVNYDNEIVEANVVNEFGVYGVCLAKGDDFVENYSAGHLLRSKSEQHDDGGVSTGVAALDSPLLV